MKRKFLEVLCIGLLSLQVAGCGTQGTKQDQTVSENEAATESGMAEEGSTQEDVFYFSEINVEDNVTLGEYKALKVSKTRQTVTEEEVENYIQYLLSLSGQKTEVTDREEVQNGDVVNIDYVGKRDGEAFDGGSAEGYDLTIGSGYFIPGFEEGLVGVKKGETVDLDLTFPENYSAEELAGVDVVFTVTVNAIYENAIPEFTDEFVEGLGIDGVTTAEQYRTFALEMMQESADETAEQSMKAQIMELATDNAQINEIPQGLIDKFKNVTLDNMNYQAAMYGMDLENYVKSYYNMDTETFEKEITAAAEESAKQAMVCIKIAQEENIEITEEDINAEVETKYADYGYESAEAFKSSVDMEEYTDSLLLNKVVDFLLENASLTEETQAE